MKLKPYPKYKDPGIQWIGVIPEGWEVNKFKHSFNSNMGQTIITLDLNANGKYPVLSATEKDNYFGRIDNPQFVLSEGDFVIPARGNSIGFVTLVKEECVSTQTTIYAKKIKKEINSKFVYYFLKYHKDNLFPFTATAIPQITVAEVKENPLIIPPPPEQTAIASFLDKKTAKIDGLIEKDKKLIELLKEKRTALINHAVTKGLPAPLARQTGLDPNVKLKDSGVEWIAKIPEGWKVRELKHCCNIKAQYGAGCKPESNPRKLDYRYVRITDINSLGRLREDSFVYLSKENSSGYILKKGDILFARSGATVGKSYYYLSEDGKCAYAGYLIRYLTNEKIMNSKYLFYYSLSSSYKDWIKLILIQSTIENVSAEKYDNLLITTPPTLEQLQIVQYLDKATAKIDKTIKFIEKNIALLQEYKKSLIHHVVTGKVDVREEC